MFFIDLYSHIKIKYRQLEFFNVQLVIASTSSSILAILHQIFETITTLIDLNLIKIIWSLCFQLNLKLTPAPKLKSWKNSPNQI